MISELVDRLRAEAKSMGTYGTDYMATLLTRSADTIEMLSEKARDESQADWYWRCPECDHIVPNLYDECVWCLEPKPMKPKVVMPKKCKGCDSASKIIEAYSRGFEDGADAVKAMPSAQPKHGEWIFKTVFPNDESEFPMGYLVCSVCGSHHSNSTPCNYCDNCGARMKGADDEVSDEHSTK